jgi:hypothetical protein
MAPSILGLASAILGIPTITTFIQNLISALTRNSEYIENVQCTRNQLQEFEDEDLLDKMSILLTPTGYSDGSLNVVIPPYEPIYTENVPFVTSEWVNLVEGWSIDETNRKLVAEATWTGTNKRAQYSISEIQIGKTVKFSFDAVVTAGKFHFLEPFPSGDVGYGSPNFINQSGSYSFTFVATGSSVYFRNKSTDFAGEITNIRVEVIEEANFDFSRGSSATRVNEQGLVEDVQILSGELVQNGNFEEIGNELVTNGNFETDSDWTKDSGWSIENGQAVCDGVGINSLQQSGITTTGKIYKLSFDVLDSNNFNFLVISTNFADTYVDADSNNSVVIGTNTFYIKPTNGTGIRFRVANGATLSIDNVSVKEVDPNDYWALGSDWTVGDNKVIGDNSDTESTQEIFPDNTSRTLRIKYTLTVDSGQVAVYMSGQVKNWKTTSGTYTDIITTTSKSIEFDGRNADPFSGTITDIIVQEIQTDTPRIDFTNDTKGHLLLEPSRTNLFPYSEDFSQSDWVKNGFGSASAPTLTLNSNISPSGSQNASRIQMDCVGNSTSDYSAIYEQLALDGSSQYTISFYVKSNTSSEQDLLFFNNSSFGQQITANSEWQRVEYTFTSNSTNTRNFGLVARGDIQQEVDILIWGGQLEQGDYSTSLINTTGAASTRNADVCNNSGSAQDFNPEEGVLYAEIAALANDGTSRRITLCDGTISNRVSLEFDEISNNIKAFISSNNISQILEYTTSNIIQFNKIAIKYKLNDMSIFLNGNEVASDLSGNMPIDLTELNFDGGTGGNDFYGKVRNVRVFTEALTDSELQELTS